MCPQIPAASCICSIYDIEHSLFINIPNCITNYMCVCVCEQLHVDTPVMADQQKHPSSLCGHWIPPIRLKKNDDQ